MGPTELESLRALAQLARLALSDEELARFAPELERILAAFGALARHTNSAPAAQAAPAANRTRQDEPLPSLENAALLLHAPASAEGFFVVPKTVGDGR